MCVSHRNSNTQSQPFAVPEMQLNVLRRLYGFVFNMVVGGKEDGSVVESSISPSKQDRYFFGREKGTKDLPSGNKEIKKGREKEVHNNNNEIIKIAIRF